MMNLITIYFSKDRPMQLDLTLRSSRNQSSGWYSQKEAVLYNASFEKSKLAYSILKEEHKSVKFKEQTDFKNDLLEIIEGFEYVMFVVDDTIFTSIYSLYDICNFLDKYYYSIGFSLRLGLNTTWCYPYNKPNIIPSYAIIDNHIIMFDWTRVGFGDFGYPMELSSSVYRVSDILGFLKAIKYQNPNELESAMASIMPFFYKKPVLASYNISVAFSNPLNRVQTTNNNRYGKREEYSPERLIDAYLNGWRTNWRDFDGFTSNGCHEEVNIEFRKGEDVAED